MARLRHSPLPLAALLGLFFASLYLLTGSSDLLHNGDTDLRYQTTQAIVDHQRLWIDHPLWTDTRVALGRGGHLYAFYAPGQALLMAPLYVIGKLIAHHLSLPYNITTLYAARSLDLWLGALLAVLFFAFALSAGYSRRTGAILTLIFGAATVAWPDAQSALEQTQVNLFLLLAVLATWRFLSSDTTAARWLLLAGTGLGLAVFTRYDALLYVPILVIYICLKRRQSGLRAMALDAGLCLAATTPWLIAVAVWNFARFGSFFQTGLHEQTLGNPFWQGLLELGVSPGKGLLWYLPIIVLLPWSLRPFIGRCPLLASLCFVLVLVPFIFYASVLYWHGDPSWGPRYLYVAVPYLVLPMGELLRQWSRRAVALRAFCLLVILASLGLQVAAVSVTQWRFWYRLEAMQEQRTNPAAWTGQPFRWGAQHYHYYWNVRESPILIQVDDVYQVARLALGAERFRESAPVDPFVGSNPAYLYPVNTLSFWWADTLHPLLGARAREGIALGLGAMLVLSGAGILTILTPPRSRRSVTATEAQLSGAGSAGG